jgi:hypothetical protein
MPESNATIHVRLSPDKRELQLSLNTSMGIVGICMDKVSVEGLIRALQFNQRQMLGSLHHN